MLNEYERKQIERLAAEFHKLENVCIDGSITQLEEEKVIKRMNNIQETIDIICSRARKRDNE